MMHAKGKTKAKEAGSRVKDLVNKRASQGEVGSSVRENRHGFRGLGIYQFSKFYSAEGVHVIDIGGPPLVGK